MSGANVTNRVDLDKMLKKIFTCKDRIRYSRERTVLIFQFEPGPGFNFPARGLEYTHAGSA